MASNTRKLSSASDKCTRFNLTVPCCKPWASKSATPSHQCTLFSGPFIPATPAVARTPADGVPVEYDQHPGNWRYRSVPSLPGVHLGHWTHAPVHHRKIGRAHV